MRAVFSADALGSMVGVALLAISLATHAAGDPCSFADSVDPRFTLELKSAQLDDQKVFVAEFELVNLPAGSDLVLLGRKSAAGFFVDAPDADVQFLSVDSMWRAVLTVGGTFLARPDKLRIPPGSRATFRTHLMTQKAASLQASDWRLLVTTADRSVCVVSKPFHSVPVPQATGLESSK